MECKRGEIECKSNREGERAEGEKGRKTQGSTFGNILASVPRMLVHIVGLRFQPAFQLL